MKLRLTIVLATTFCLRTMVSAQTNAGTPTEEKEKNAIQSIEEESDGKVKMKIPDDILELLLSTPKTEQQRQGGNHHRMQNGAKRTGYRIQVFSDGHNPSSLQARAKARGNAIVARLPKYRGQVYTFSRSPNWYTTVGNFSTIGEANAALHELRRSFPSFSSEMRVVKSAIVILK